jgi:hypothetical protein
MSRHREVPYPCWAESLPVRVDAVVARWVDSVRSIDPWDNMRLDDIAGALRSLTSALVNAACDDDDARRRRLATAAYQHGRYRRAQGVPRRLLAVELTSLRDAIRADLESGDWSDALVSQAVDGLVADLRLARRCAQCGYDETARTIVSLTAACPRTG